MPTEFPVKPVLLRELLGESLREERVAQGKTLREVSKGARVSLGYLSEVERGQKEASSELLGSICSRSGSAALGGAECGQREDGDVRAGHRPADGPGYGPGRRLDRPPRPPRVATAVLAASSGIRLPAGPR